MFSGNIFCCDRYLVSDSSDAGRNADLKKKRLWVKFVNHNYIYMLCADFFYMNWFWEANGVSCDVLPKCLYLINTNKIDGIYMPITLSFHGLQEHVILK